MIAEEAAHSQLVRQAQAGDAESLSVLAGLVQQRLCAYFRRITLAEDVAQDLTQDTLVSVLSSIGTLRQVDRFWPWVFRIATNRVTQHYREAARHRTVQMTGPLEAGAVPTVGGGEGVLVDAARTELAHLTRAAMAGLSHRHRAVLALRFFEDLSHSEIARILECSEMATRAALFRAKAALVRELKRRGVSRSLLGAALLAFGQATAVPEAAAAVTVSAAALAETALAGVLTAKAKLAAGAAALLLVAASATWWLPSTAVRSPVGPVRWVHFTRHHLQAISDPVGGWRTQSQGAYEHWYYYPEGPGGPVMFRMQRWDPTQQRKLCWWIENGEANHYIHSGQRTVYIHNAHLRHGRSTLCLPTDPPEFAEFLREVEGQTAAALLDSPDMTYQRDARTGFVVSHEDRRFPEMGPQYTAYDYSEKDASLFDSPTGMTVVDERDDMHRRGWTFFQIEGHLDGRAVRGYGCLPLMYDASRAHPAWLRVSVDGRPVLQDDGRMAERLDDAGNPQMVYTGGSFFRGLARPWRGLHTLDVIRRDAANERIWFSTQWPESGRQATVTLVDSRGDVHHMLRYTVDLERDLLDRIEIWRGPQGVFDERVGELALRYDDEVTASPEDLTAPRAVSSRSALLFKGTVLWPLQLLDPPVSQAAVPQAIISPATP